LRIFTKKKDISILWRIIKLCIIYGKWGDFMEITDVRIRKIDTEGKMKAVVSVTFDNEFVVHDIKIIESQNGMFIAMPSRKTPDGEFRDIAHPINAETREKIQTAILRNYESLVSEAAETAEAGGTTENAESSEASETNE